MTLRLTLYTRSRCGLCDLLYEDLKTRYGARVPVVVGDGAVLCEGRSDASAVRAFLDRHAPMTGAA
jgi:hypothetical protein